MAKTDMIALKYVCFKYYLIRFYHGIRRRGLHVFSFREGPGQGCEPSTSSNYFAFSAISRQFYARFASKFEWKFFLTKSCLILFKLSNFLYKATGKKLLKFQQFQQLFIKKIWPWKWLLKIMIFFCLTISYFIIFTLSHN